MRRRKIIIRRRKNPERRRKMKIAPVWSPGAFDIDITNFEDEEEYRDAIFDYIKENVTLESRIKALLEADDFFDEFEEGINSELLKNIQPIISEIIKQSDFSKSEKDAYYTIFMISLRDKINIGDIIIDNFFDLNRDEFIDILNSTNNLEKQAKVLNVWYHNYDDRYDEG